MARIHRIVAGAIVSLGLAVGVTGLAQGAEDGKALYTANCAKCHGDDGRAETPVGKAMKAASLVDPRWAAEDSTSALIAAFHANAKHKAVAGNVSDDDLTLIAAYVRELNSAGE